MTQYKIVWHTIHQHWEVWECRWWGLWKRHIHTARSCGKAQEFVKSLKKS